MRIAAPVSPASGSETSGLDVPVHQVPGELGEIEAGEIDALDLGDGEAAAIAPAATELPAPLFLQDAPEL